MWRFRPRSDPDEANRLLAAVAERSRDPWLFAAGRFPDTLEGRFESLALHAALVLIGLKTAADAGDLSQRFTDALFSQIDAGLREAGVGDLSVPRRMRRLAGDFYGRLAAYEQALVAGAPALAAALERNVGFADRGSAAQAAAYVGAFVAALASPQALRDPEAWRRFRFGKSGAAD